MAGNKPNLSSPNHSFDKTKLYNRVVFQQGKPILDIDLNDMSVALQAQSTASIAAKMGYGPSQIDYRDWAMTAVDSSTLLVASNRDNFAMTLGRADSLKGVIDTRESTATGKQSSIIFDYHLKDSTDPITDSFSREWSNYLLRGKVTASTSTTQFSDASKEFDGTLAGHRLAGYDETTLIDPQTDTLLEYLTLTADSTNLDRDVPDDCVIRVTEEPCRVRFLTGNLEGQIQDITSATGINLVTDAFSAPPDVGSEYVILPPNTLTSYRNEYDAVNTFENSKSEGLSGLPKLLTYLQVFEEDISVEEDPAIQSNVFGSETTHRSQLRWCIRVAKVYTSKTGDSYNNASVGPLTPAHLFAFLLDGQYEEHRLLVDAAMGVSGVQNGINHVSLWETKNELGDNESSIIGTQSSPYTDSFGITPLHLINSEESTQDYLYWSFLKAVLLSQSGTGKNDFVILNQFHSETKYYSLDTNTIANQSLSPYFFPNVRKTNLNSLLEHPWLSTGASHYASNENEEPAVFKTPPRVFSTHAELSIDNMKSRTLHGIGGGVIYGDYAPLVFQSASKHLSFLDQALLGLSGLGSAQGETLAGKRIPAATNYTLEGTTTGLAQSGYGKGAIVPLNPLSSASEITGFTTGTSSYLLREKGSRSSHEVLHDDAELGWSLFKGESTGLVTNDRSDFSIRGWEEGLAQSAAFLQGLNFRKLAIKTTAHKSQDLFTISEAPVVQNDQVGQVVNQAAASTAFQVPYHQSETNNGNLFLDSYSGVANNTVGQLNVDFNATSFLPANVDRYDPKALLTQYQATGGVKSFSTSPEASHRDLAVSYGPWNRFDSAEVVSSTNFTSNTDAPTYVGDLWSNRCTAMRLRYHVGDFYPGDNDANDIPRNLLVDSMNLFVKVEPLSLAHWMTMPKHQHSILENSLSFAEGIEALLKVAHGLGDTQKLVNSSGQPLIQSESPSLSEGGDYPSRSVGDVDPLNLPFEHHRHPFVHWYHPAMHKVQSPHPDGTNDTYTNSSGNPFKLTVYPKWGRRSLIVPALVPSRFGSKVLEGQNNDITGTDDYLVPYMGSRTNGTIPFDPAFPDDVSGSSNIEYQIAIDLEQNTSETTVGTSSLPYPYHGSASTNTGTTTITADDNTAITFRNNQITFPAVGSVNNGIRPGPVFLPASRIYASQLGDETEVKLGFNTMLSPLSSTYWNSIESSEDNFPYEERDLINVIEAGNLSDLPADFINRFTAWSTPVMRAAVSTHTVAGIVDLVRTSFATGLDTSTLSSDYTFTMPTNVMDSNYEGEQVPAIGPDNPADTLFVGDMGTALGGFINRAGFMSPLNLGVPMRINYGLVPNDFYNATEGVRDSFELASIRYGFGSNTILSSFTAINNMGLQQKLMWNCSFRVLHARPSGMDGSRAQAPKSITEVFLAHDRTNDMEVKTLPAPSGAFKKPFIHLMSTHPATNPNFPNKSNMEHLYSMVSDSTGGTHTLTPNESSEERITYDYTRDQVKTSSMGDTFGADPFDYSVNQALLVGDNPIRSYDNLESNSGIEIDLLSELDMMHSTPTNYGISEVASVNGTNLTLQSMMPTANELTLPGDHELIFVLYTGHYGAKMYDTEDEVNISYIPSVAGCHLTATLEINRPSDRVKSVADQERHYGKTVDGNPINTYSIPSTK